MEWINTIAEIAEVIIIVGLVLWVSRLQKRIEKLERESKPLKTS
ncbi:hypothetical protein [Helicobacter sp. 12S02634-8]|nr:hypothetical protein [Helicobacter sp. 12S02634-8]